MDEDKFLNINPSVVFRENFDDMAIVYNPESGKAFGLNQVGVLIWKLFDGRHTFRDILGEVDKSCFNTPENADEHLRGFITELLDQGLIGYVDR